MRALTREQHVRMQHHTLELPSAHKFYDHHRRVSHLEGEQSRQDLNMNL